MFQALLNNASRRVCNHAQRINSSDRTLSSIVRGTNCKLSKSTQSIFSNTPSRSQYHTSIYTLKSRKKKKSRQAESDSAVTELGRYERSADGEWVRRAVTNKRTAVLSPELEADIAHVLAQDVDGLDAPSLPHKSPRAPKSKAATVTRSTAPRTQSKAGTAPQPHTSKTTAPQPHTSKTTTAPQPKKKTKSAKSKQSTASGDAAVLAQYQDLLDASDFKQEVPREIRAPSESDAETERAVAQVMDWLRAEKLTDLCAIDLRAKTDWARFMVVATAMSERHNRAAAETIAHKLGQLRRKSYEVHSGGEDNWLIVFTGDMAIELFTAERRQFYDVERLWVLKRSLQEELDIDPDDLARFQFDEEDGMYDDEVRAKIAAERRARGEVVEEPVAAVEERAESAAIPYSSRASTAEKKSRKKRK